MPRVNRKFLREWLFGLVLLALVSPATGPAFGQDSKQAVPAERAAMIAEQNWLRVLRDFEGRGRHLFFLQSNAMLSAYGGWSEGVGYGDHIVVVKEAGGIIEADVNRLRSQLEKGKWGESGDAERLAEAVGRMQMAIAASVAIADFLIAGDLASANAVYKDQSAPLFKAIWASSYTLIKAAERRFPSR